MKTQNYMYDIKKVVDGAVASENDFCMGYLNPNASGNGYISTLKLSVDGVMVHDENLDEVTEGIVAYDRCEADDAYIGQINMLTASSFCGLNGAIWGYDIAVAENLRGTLLYKQSLPDRGSIPVYSVYPLLDATMRLFGVDTQRRFNPMPGAHVVCANKSKITDLSRTEGIWVWSAIALAILEDRNLGANLFIEDANTVPGNNKWQEVKRFLDGTLKKVTNSVVLCGADQQVKYKEIFTGYKFAYVPPLFVGCALTCAPYITLAKKAIPGGPEHAAELIGKSIIEWEKELHLPPLPPVNHSRMGYLGPDGVKEEYGPAL